MLMKEGSEKAPLIRRRRNRIKSTTTEKRRAQEGGKIKKQRGTPGIYTKKRRRSRTSYYRILGKITKKGTRDRGREGEKKKLSKDISGFGVRTSFSKLTGEKPSSKKIQLRN